ncbi:xylulokinase [Plebeiibacterium sediminum]|uniref:FGGY family carbohydrate kinase n=1 Tax=Plebeiibacterium sediminum TaxID=2992112 RepID=A0AAE3M6J8_9BACT|nr:FGGY family carbohydrate kinase [Plebeiobacterium sediminum]MCW3787775.1 FGGY family carbohydrate kinase [Plebeiobacterium sediminum]
MQLLGFDIGSSSVKVSVLDVDKGVTVSSAQYPETEMTIVANKPGWAEQDPELWYQNLKKACNKALSSPEVKKDQIKAIGISYQMHGLVIVDEKGEVLRPSIIWCDSRAAEIGNKAFAEIGEDWCLQNLLNSPGNFTASKLKWVKDNEPELYSRIYKIMLPGDYIAYRLTGQIMTTASGLSEGIFWEFPKDGVSDKLLEYYGFQSSMIPEIKTSFSDQGTVLDQIAEEFDLPKGVKVTYRAGDQPNNAFSLNVLNPGEVAATGGTSGVVYGVTDNNVYDDDSRVNTFAHVNHQMPSSSLGVLLCINGTGILNSWMNKNLGKKEVSYPEMNDLASGVPIGSDGLTILPFGNGSERILKNVDYGSQINHLNFNIHTPAHFYRAAQEGIAFSFKYGMDIMGEMGIETNVIRAGKANMFLSDLFKNTLSNISGATIELYNTDGAAGAARGAGVGANIYASFEEAFGGLSKVGQTEPNTADVEATQEAYEKWKSALNKL